MRYCQGIDHCYINTSNHFSHVLIKSDCILNRVECTKTYKSEAKASPPGLSIRIIAALNFFDAEKKKSTQCDQDSKNRADMMC
jgi:hypothetical protein